MLSDKLYDIRWNVLVLAEAVEHFNDHFLCEAHTGCGVKGILCEFIFVDIMRSADWLRDCYQKVSGEFFIR